MISRVCLKLGNLPTKFAQFNGRTWTLSDCHHLSFNWGISTKYPKIAMLYNVDVMMKHCIWGHPVFRQKPLKKYIGDLQTLSVYPMCFFGLASHFKA